MSIAVIILAAGQGSRMASDRPKVLHEVGHEPLLHHVLRAGAALDPARVVVVAGPGRDDVAAAARAVVPHARIAVQQDRLGTAHAVAQARAALEGFDGDAVVLYGDTPFVQPQTLERMRAARAEGAGVVVLGFEAADPTGYGRLMAEEDGTLSRIVEHAEATIAERAVSLCNSGVVCADAATLFRLIDKVGNDNAKGEYYLTDIVALARRRGLRAAAVACPEAETLGVNTRADLAFAEATFQAAARTRAMAAGATLTAPETVFLAHDTALGRDVTVAPFVTFGPGVTVGDSAEIRGFCHLEGCRIAPGAQIGPYARLRPGAEVAEAAHIGNFVEVKAARIGPGAKVNHLAYVGDASVGEGANIGAGAITCNYDGVSKHQTQIGAHAFVGSNAALVAPVSIGDGAYVASGSVVTQDVPADDLAIARARQVNKPGLAAKLRAHLKRLKEG